MRSICAIRSPSCSPITARLIFYGLIFPTANKDIGISTPTCRSWAAKGKDDWEAEKLIATARAIRPGIIIDNRTEIEQDLFTPEQIQINRWVTHPKTGEKVVWEACQTFSGSPLGVLPG